MASPQRSPEEVLRAVEYHHEQYLRSLRSVYGLPTASRMERTGSNKSMPGSPPLPAVLTSHSSTTAGLSHHQQEQPATPRPQHASSFGSDLAVPRPRRLTNESHDPRQQQSPVVSGGLHHPLLSGASGANIPRSLYDIETESDEESGFIPLLPPSQAPPPTSASSQPPIPSVQGGLSPASFDEQQLVDHVRAVDEAAAGTVAALGDVWRKREELDAGKVFDSLAFASHADELWTSTSCEVYDVDRDGMTMPRHDVRGNSAEDIVDAAAVWMTIKDVNLRGRAVGRMTFLQDPTPLIFGAVHLTMGDHFDMDELYAHLITTEPNRGKTKAYMLRAFEPQPIRQRSFFFVFKYYTVVGEGLTPAQWQQFDYRPPDRKSADHIDIAECSSILALSLEGPPRRQLPLRSRRRRTVTVGSVYDTFAPWHLLSVQCFPDDEHSIRTEEFRKPYYNGPYAFLDCLAAEYRDAVKRYTQLNSMISKLITPPNQFMFDVKLRDKLLFEDKDFTYSRRYFWAYNTLGVINDGIKAMAAAHDETFTPDFWAGRSQLLWPHPDPDSAPGQAYAALMGGGPRRELARAVQDLWSVHDKNSAIRKEINSLREQLFSGSSVKESRRAIEQGDNIKILTSVSMVFLPLTFVTSVFGITEFHIAASDWRFPVTMVSVCVPFFLLIIVLQTRAGLDAARRLGAAVVGCVRGVGDRAHDRRERRRLQQIVATQQRLQAQAALLNEGGEKGRSGTPAGGGDEAGVGLGAEARVLRRLRRRHRREIRQRQDQQKQVIAVVRGTEIGGLGPASRGWPWWPWGMREVDESLKLPDSNV